MDAHRRGVHKMQVLVEAPAGIRLGLQPLQHKVEHTRLAPAVEPARYRSHRTVARRQVLPGSARAQDPEHAVEDLPVILRRPARARLPRRQQQGVLLPFRVNQFKA